MSSLAWSPRPANWACAAATRRHRQVHAGDVVVAGALAGHLQRTAVQRQRIVDSVLVLGQVALLQQVGDQLVVVAKRGRERLVLAQVVVRLGQVAHAPVADRDVEQQRFGVGLEAALLVQVLGGEQVGDGTRLVAEQRHAAATHAEAVGQQAIILDPARRRDSRLVFGHHIDGGAERFQRGGAAVMEAGFALAVVHGLRARQALVGVRELGLRVVVEAPVAEHGPVPQVAHRIAGGTQARQFRQALHHQRLRRLDGKPGVAQLQEQRVECRGRRGRVRRRIRRAWHGHGCALLQQQWQQHGCQPWISGLRSTHGIPCASRPPAPGHAIVRHGRAAVRRLRHFCDNHHISPSAAATKGGVARAPRWMSAL
jgi:hypothetical protein